MFSLPRGAKYLNSPLLMVLPLNTQNTVNLLVAAVVECVWNVMEHGDVGEGKWRGNWWMEWVASTLQTTSERDVSSTTTADAHNSAACSRLNWCLRRFKWTRPFRGETESGFCACAITFRTQSTLRICCDTVTRVFRRVSKSRKETISYLMRVCMSFLPFARPALVCCQWSCFHGISYLASY